MTPDIPVTSFELNALYFTLVTLIPSFTLIVGLGGIQGNLYSKISLFNRSDIEICWSISVEEAVTVK